MAEVEYCTIAIGNHEVIAHARRAVIHALTRNTTEELTAGTKLHLRTVGSSQTARLVPAQCRTISWTDNERTFLIRTGTGTVFASDLSCRTGSGGFTLASRENTLSVHASDLLIARTGDNGGTGIGQPHAVSIKALFHGRRTLPFENGVIQARFAGMVG